MLVGNGVMSRTLTLGRPQNCALNLHLLNASVLVERIPYKRIPDMVECQLSKYVYKLAFYQYSRCRFNTQSRKTLPGRLELAQPSKASPSSIERSWRLCMLVPTLPMSDKTSLVHEIICSTITDLLSFYSSGQAGGHSQGLQADLSMV